MMIVFIFYLFYCTQQWSLIFVRGQTTDLSSLSLEKVRLWNENIAQLRNETWNIRFEFLNYGDQVNIPLFYNDPSDPDPPRSIFKQNVKKRVKWILFEDQLNTQTPSNYYEKCLAALYSSLAYYPIAGLYVYTNTRLTQAMGIAVVTMTNAFKWFNGTEAFQLNEETILKNGTELTLVFEATIYYSSNSDLPGYNQQMDDIIQQARVTIDNNVRFNLEKFFLMNNLLCRRHSMILYDEVRASIFTCQVSVTFQCPLNQGSSCWLEEKAFSNIQLYVANSNFACRETVTLRIDV